MAIERKEGILRQLKRIFRSSCEDQTWENLIRNIERSYLERCFDRLEGQLEQAWNLLQGRPQDREQAARSYQLAQCYEQYAGNFGRSEELYRQAIDLFQRHVPDDPLNAAPALNSLALLLIHQRRNSEAEPLIRRLLPIVEERFGKDHPEYATCLENLAATLRHTDCEAEAAQIRKQALTIRQEYRRNQS